MKNSRVLIVILLVLIIIIFLFIINKSKSCDNESIEINFIANCPISQTEQITPPQIHTFFHLFNEELNPVITFKRKDLMDSNIDSVKFTSNLNEIKCNDIKDVLDKSKKQVRTTENMYAMKGSSNVNHKKNYVTFYLIKGISNPNIEKNEFPFEQPELLRNHIDKELENGTLFEKNEAKKINIVILCGNAPPPPPPPPCSDKDRDGVCDEDDECENAPGPRSNNGCPISGTNDQDGDGVLDTDDNCPTDPDCDDDGVVDGDDDCPNDYGPRSNNGCPLEPTSDSDGDGFEDNIDKCPNVASSSNSGCPVIDAELVKIGGTNKVKWNSDLKNYVNNLQIKVSTTEKISCGGGVRGYKSKDIYLDGNSSQSLDKLPGCWDGFDCKLKLIYTLKTEYKYYKITNPEIKKNNREGTITFECGD